MTNVYSPNTTTGQYEIKVEDMLLAVRESVADVVYPDDDDNGDH
jgi:hypothetical protein